MLISSISCLFCADSSVRPSLLEEARLSRLDSYSIPSLLGNFRSSVRFPLNDDRLPPLPVNRFEFLSTDVYEKTYESFSRVLNPTVEWSAVSLTYLFSWSEPSDDTFGGAPGYCTAPLIESSASSTNMAGLTGLNWF